MWTNEQTETPGSAQKQGTDFDVDERTNVLYTCLQYFA